MSTEFILKLREELKEPLLQDHIKETAFEKNPLEVALKKEYDDAAIFYIENGADIHFNYEQPIRYAIYYDKLPMLKLLLEKGANRVAAICERNSEKYIDLLLDNSLQLTNENVCDILRCKSSIIFLSKLFEKKYITKENVIKILPFCIVEWFNFLCEKFPDELSCENKNLIDEVVLNMDRTNLYNCDFCFRFSNLLSLLLEKNTLTEKSMEILSRDRKLAQLLFENYKGAITKVIMINILGSGDDKLVRDAIERGGNVEEISEKDLSTWTEIYALRNLKEKEKSCALM